MSLNLSDVYYDLPADRIAQFPLAKRDDAKLLVYRQGQIEHQAFRNLAEHLPEGALLVLNDTKVVPARLHFQRATGAHIEVLLLHPFLPAEVAEAMRSYNQCTWTCMVGNKKPWKEGEILVKEFDLPEGLLTLQASWANREDGVVHFHWNQAQISWAELLTHMGALPLPPYLQREVTSEDNIRYQTTYAQHEGAVAAPTAGLHFTQEVFDSLTTKNISPEYITLHVSAGTFQPIKVENIIEHPMHAEQLVFTRTNIERLCQHEGNIIAVGTTSMRALESLYWYGAKLSKDGQASFHIEKMLPYEMENPPSFQAAMQAILKEMDTKQIVKICGETQIFMFPSYQFRVCKGLITNFHLPSTTLMFLVAAFIGTDWRKVYEAALAHDYRFLSYGDSSLLLP